MVTEPTPLEPMNDARAHMLARDLERRLSGRKVHLFVTRWLALPLMLIALLAMVLGLILGFGSPGPVIGGAVAIAGAAGGLASWARRQEDALAELEDARGALLESHRDPDA